MPEIETDYLVVGAGATGMAFADTLLAQSDAEVVMVDRRHRPGGHWLDAYPFVRLHQPSAYYGVGSRVLGNDRIDESGPNAGFYERATAAEICDYFNRVLEEDLIPTGRLRFLPMSDYLGRDGDEHRVRSLLSGAETNVKVRRKIVDATYIESEIPARHTPAYEIDDGVRVMPPNDLVHLDDNPSGFTIIGAGKTAMDTCNWLLDVGVEPDRIRWIRKRDGWFFNRAFMQPRELVASYMELQARFVECAASAANTTEFFARLESEDVMVRIDRTCEPAVFRGATLSMREVAALREIEHVVRRGRVLRLGNRTMTFDDGELDSDPGELYIDCTAVGLPPRPACPVFAGDRITMQYVTIGVAPWSAATIAATEALCEGDDAEKNALCPPVVFTGVAADTFRLALSGMAGLGARGAHPQLGPWNEECRLNPAQGAAAHLDEPRVQDAFSSMATHFGPALENLARVTATPSN